MIYTVALTGNIASGKTEVANYLQQYDITIIDADIIAKELLTSDSKIIQTIIGHFGSKILLQNGQIDRRKLREIIFNNKDEKIWLENLLHPIIRSKIKTIQQNAVGLYCVLVIPLLNDKNQHHYHFDSICLVKTSKDSQLKRIMLRDNVDISMAESVIKQQINAQEKLLNISYVIENTRTLLDLENQANILHEKLLITIKNNKN